MKYLIFSTLILVLTQCAETPPKVSGYIEGATLWYQTAGETKALQYQAFNLAKVILDKDLKENKKQKKTRAIVVDVDETILDNSPCQAKLIHQNKSYPEFWNEWVDKAQAKAIPGAVEFLNYAASKGVRVFYISNRYTHQKEASIKNLKAAGFPDVSDATLLFRDKEWSKEGRRQEVLKNHRLVILMGDNLNDFSPLFEKKSVEQRNQSVHELKQRWGADFIVLPNPMYGDWESAVYNNDSKLPEVEKAKLRLGTLQGY